jgi:hypothetical protein
MAGVALQDLVKDGGIGNETCQVCFFLRFDGHWCVSRLTGVTLQTFFIPPDSLRPRQHFSSYQV